MQSLVLELKSNGVATILSNCGFNVLGSLAGHGSQGCKEMTTYKSGGIAEGGVAIIVGLLIGLIAAQLLPTANAQDSVVAPFDHSNCQYPDRTTNPPDGCDNSDPCDPAQVKGGSGDCKDNDENHAPIVSQPVSPAPATAECVGK